MNKSVAASWKDAGRRRRGSSSSSELLSASIPRVVEGRSGPFGGQKVQNMKHRTNPARRRCTHYAAGRSAKPIGPGHDASLSESSSRSSATLDPRHPARLFDAIRELVVEISSFSTQTGASPPPHPPLRPPGCSVRQTLGLPRVQVKR